MTVAYSTSSVTVQDGTTAAIFTIKRSGTTADLSQASSVAFETQDITAVAGTDYTATSGTVAFAADVTEATVNVAILAEGYAESTTRTFLLSLTGYGSATGSIVPSSSSNTTQTFLYLPEDDDSVTVPTASSPGTNLKYQALYSGFSKPDANSVEMPLAYLRLGFARADLNDYERVVLNSDAYQPSWDDTPADGPPVESASMMNMMLPRGIDRRGLTSAQVTAAMKDNAHLDGIFLYSDKNYTLTVKGSTNTVIQGDQVLYVGGDVRNLIMGNWANCYYWELPGYLRYMEGMDEIDGTWWEYYISSAYVMNISSDKTIDYKIGYGFSASASADVSVSNGAKFEVGNSIGMTVKGLEGSITADVMGAFEVKMPLIGHTATQKSIDQSASERITFSVNSGLSTAWTAPVQVVAGLNALTAAAATTPAWITAFSPEGDFYTNATVEGLKGPYKEPFTDVIPDLTLSMGALAFVTTLLCAGLQKLQSVTPPVMPQIDMTPAGLLLSGDVASTILLNSEGITITAPTLQINAGTITIDSVGPISFAAPLISAESDDFTMAGNLEVGMGLTVASDAAVVGEFYATVITSG